MILGVSWADFALVSGLLWLKPMNTSDKKLSVLESTEESPDTEKLLLARLKNSSSSEDYFRWMLFVVGFYRGVNKVDAATELPPSIVPQSSIGWLERGMVAAS